MPLITFNNNLNCCIHNCHCKYWFFKIKSPSCAINPRSISPCYQLLKIYWVRFIRLLEFMYILIAFIPWGFFCLTFLKLLSDTLYIIISGLVILYLINLFKRSKYRFMSKGWQLFYLKHNHDACYSNKHINYDS